MPVEVLLVDDSPCDVRLTQAAFREAGGGSINLHVATDGTDAMDFLRREGIQAAAAQPQQGRTG